MKYDDMTPHSVVVQIALEAAENKPLEERIVIYRAIAETTDDRTLSQALTLAANALQKSSASCRQLLLNFRAKHGGGQ
jgi:hypothetical protein